MQETFDLLKLIQFLHQTLMFTEEVKNILKADCDEAMYCLKPWHIGRNLQQEIKKDSCTCIKSENEVEEIAASISRALIQTQELREKLSINTTERKSRSLSMYERSKEIGNKKQIRGKNLTVNSKNANSAQDLNIVKPGNLKTNADNRSEDKILQRDAQTKYNRQLVKYSGVKMGGNKNFLAINKQNIKNIKEINQKCKDVSHKLESNAKPNSSVMMTKCIKFDERRSVASTSELKNLIKKVSATSSNFTLTLNKNNARCPLHGDSTLHGDNYEQNLVTVTIVDSFNTADIPKEIVRPLKVYHAYLNTTKSSENPFSEKRQKAINKFLIEFNKGSASIQKKLTQKNYVIDMLFNFVSLFQTLFSGDLKKLASNLSNIKTMHRELNSLWVIYNKGKEFDSIEILKNVGRMSPQYIFSHTKQWMSNGVWNSVTNFEGVSRSCCIRYTSEKQLLLFFDVLQKLQYIHYCEDLIEITEREVLCNIKFFKPIRVEYAKIYKMISILYQGLNPKISVLVRSDK